MHARASARRNHGFGRRRLRRLLRLWPTSSRKRKPAGASIVTHRLSRTTIDKSTKAFRDKILRKCGESVEMKEKFFEKYADEIERLSREMAKRFADGKKLLTMGNGGSLCDALHFAVEFTHPIIEKRAAFPAIPLDDRHRDDDRDGQRHRFLAGLRQSIAVARPARRHGAGRQHERQVAQSDLRVWKKRARKKCSPSPWAGKDGGRFPEVADYCFIVPSYSIHRIQEVHATLCMCFGI